MNFVRNFGEYHNSNNRRHLIISVMFLPKTKLIDGNSKYLQNYLNVLSNEKAYSDKINNIITVKEDSVKDLN